MNVSKKWYDIIVVNNFCVVILVWVFYDYLFWVFLLIFGFIMDWRYLMMVVYML